MAFTLHYRKKYTILSMDPGVVNFAWCVTENQVVVACGMLKKPFKKLLNENVEEYKNEMYKLMTTYKPDIVLCERFMTRSFLAAMVELIGIMIGYVINGLFPFQYKYHLITAASWKLAIKKILDLKSLYLFAKKEYKLPPHIIDCLCTNRYVFNNFKYNKEDKDWIYKNLRKCKQTMVKE